MVSSMFDKKVMTMLYSKAAKPEDLVWHRDEPPKLLADVVQKRTSRGKALDLGCGAGVFSIYLAKQGYEVTGLDFIPRALEMAKERAANAGVKLQLVLANLLEWQTADQFDLVLDSGCMHTIGSSQIAHYKAQLLRWLAPQGDFLLFHFGKRHLLDWRPIGPRRRTHKMLARFFAPELQEEVYEQQLMTGIPLPIGPTVLGQSFWFKRPK
jgi:cyclopropane fatty-acyl-phospholipid synthase-like methyltransferase